MSISQLLPDTTEEPVIKRQKLSEQSEELPVPIEKEGTRLRCMYFLPHKHGRQCNMTRRSGDKFCFQHKPASDSDSLDDKNVRIPCPINPRHSILKIKLNQHLKKCQSRQKLPKEKWYSLDQNIVGQVPSPNLSNQAKEPLNILYQKLASLLESTWESVISKTDPQLEVLSHDGLHERLYVETASPLK